MRKRFLTCVAAGILACVGPALRADVWDVGGDNDNDFGSDNELVHGLDQVHDMAAQQGGTVEDVDWYSFRRPCNASYEIQVDGLTGDIPNGTGLPALEVLDSDATTVLRVSEPVSSLGAARRITFLCFENVPEVIGYARVSQPSCGLSCTATDQYQIHFRETTALIPRFNNSATQVSLLVLQNSTEADVVVTVLTYDATGTLFDFVGLSLSPNQPTVINLATFGGGELAGKSGSLKVINTAPYGALSGKVVSVEPATGFTFDTPLVYKPY